MLNRLTRIQLSIFAVVTVLTVGAIAIFYLHLPAAVGIGSYKVTADFVAGGGLYQNANVTYSISPAELRITVGGAVLKQEPMIDYRGPRS